MHSAWGTFDWIFEDALKAGYRVGIVAASDGHKGRIGASYPGAGKFGSMGGLTCHLMPSLDRDSLFAAFRRRRHYASTGCRPFIDVSVPQLTDAIVRISDAESETVTTAQIGDIVTCSNSEAELRFDISAHVGIERIDIRDGVHLLKRILTEPEKRRAGRRLRIQCEGAEYRGRGRLVNWNMTVTAVSAAVQKVLPINFWNPDSTVGVDGNTVHWENVTTGGFHAVDVWLDETTGGFLQLRNNDSEFQVDMAELGTEDMAYDLGGLGKAIRITRLPDEQLVATIQDHLRLPLIKGEERCLYLRVTFEDGHVAWTSPIYLTTT